MAQQLNLDTRETLYVARQPILDAAGTLFGYELLYREATGAEVELRDDLASARVLTDAVVNLGLDTITGGKPAFLNLSRPLLLRLPALLPATSAVFELHRDIPLNDETFAACQQLHDAGYALGLDDFDPEADAAALLPFAKFVKVNTSRTSPATLTSIARGLASSGIRLIADEVRTREVFEHTKAAGYHLFQGRFFSQPTVCQGTAVPGRHLAYLRLLAALNRPDITLSEVEDLVKHDVSLSYRVLRCVNSAAFGLRREVLSIRQALLMLGLAPVRTWASVWCVAGLNTGGISELVTTVLIRGRSCELLAEQRRDEHSSEMFLVGLCSMLDLMLGRPMREAIADLPLSTAARQALIGEPNAQRTLLDAVITYEQAEWDTATASAETIGLRGADLAEAYTASLRWARELATAA
jgi:c-di-GMP-related signal transduction protein